MGTLHEAPCTLIIISHLILIKVRNVADRIFRENQNTDPMFNYFFLSLSL